MAERSASARVVIAIALWLVAGEARAQAPTAGIALTNCPSELGPAVESALELELSIAAPWVRAGVADGTLRCSLVCDATGITAIVVAGEQRVEQRVEGLDHRGSRRLAITLAELLDASAPMLPESGPEPDLPLSPPEAPIARPERGAESLITRLRLAGGAWLGGEPLLALGALEIGLEIAPTPNVAVVVAGAGAIGGLEVEVGHLDVRLVSASASLRLGSPFDLVWIGGGPAVRGGAVLWTGTPERSVPAVGREFAGAWLGLGAVAVLLVQIGDTPVRAGFEAEGGGIAFGSSALVLEAVGARIGGAWIELRAAIDVAID